MSFSVYLTKHLPGKAGAAESDWCTIAFLRPAQVTDVHLSPPPQCDMYEAPLTCLTFVKEQKKLAAGMASDQGKVPIFKWGDFGEHVS